jgi:hypothetical protein
MKIGVEKSDGEGERDPADCLLRTWTTKILYLKPPRFKELDRRWLEDESASRESQIHVSFLFSDLE